MESEKSYGPIIGLVIIIIIIALGSVYFLGKRGETTPTSQQAALENIQTQSSSDEIADINTDLQATDFSDLDAELTDLDAELGV